MCSKQEIENKRLAALERIRTKNKSLSKSFTSDSSFEDSPARRSNGGGPIYQNNVKNSKFQPYYNRNSVTASQSTSMIHPETPPNKVVSGSIYLISDDRFEVKPSEFSEKLIAVFKTIPSRIFDCEKRLWNFSLQHYEELQNKIIQLKPTIVLGVIPQYVLNEMRIHNKKSQVDLCQIDETLQNKLMPFQKEGVCFGIEKNGRCMIADDMGLGKTFQALAIAHYYKKDWPLLIITTSSMRETWEKKIHELLPSVPMANIVCISSGKEKQFLNDNHAQIIIISYKMTTLCTRELNNKRFGAIILDESHLLKSHKAQSTECVMKITKRAKRVILLSGTPALSRPAELFTQLNIIEPNFFKGFIEYGKRYCAGKQTNFGWDMTGQSNLTELHCLLHKKFLIRRTKEEILPDLIEKTRTSVILDSSLLALSEDTRKDLSALANSYSRKKAVDKQAALITFFSESAKVKIPAICKYISEVVKNKDKFLVFAHHRNVLEAICYTLDENRVHYICIDGSTKSDYRSVLVEKFQYNESCKCAVLSITAANAGITLTAAQLVIFAELHWNPGIITQAEARAHRIGQSGRVNVRYLLAKGTSDDYMWPMLEDKLQILNQVGLTKDSFENTTLVQQQPPNSMTNYVSISMRGSSNFIPGTNIRRGSENRQKTDTNESTSVNNTLTSEDTFFDDNEDDQLLANINI